MQKRLKVYGEQAGIQGVRVFPHTLRHTRAEFHAQRTIPFHAATDSRIY